MSQISSFNALPDSNSRISSDILANNAAALRNGAAAPPSSSTAASDVAQTSPLQVQLARLNSVLNSLQANATSVRSSYVHALNKVKSGTYQVHTLDVSRSIVNESIVKH